MAQHGKIIRNYPHRHQLLDATGNVRLKANPGETIHPFRHRACLYALEQGILISRSYDDYEDYPETKDEWIRTDAVVYDWDEKRNLRQLFDFEEKIIYASPVDPEMSIQISKRREEGWECYTYQGESSFLDTEEEAREEMFSFMKQERLRFLL